MTQARSCSTLHQVLKFCLVGLANTFIDLIITNLLVILTGAKHSEALFGISLISASIATVNSYFLNRKWTFQATREHMPKHPFLRFFGMAVVSILVNTSIFLFTYRMLTLYTPTPTLLALNIAKITGITLAAIVGFLGYRLHVFRLPALLEFRKSFDFTSAPRTTVWKQAWALCSISLAACLLFLAMTTAITGDAVHYAEIAENLAHGRYDQVEVFWSSLFSYWASLFTLMGFDRIPSAILSSLIPGILLVIPVTLIARHLYGEKVAWIAGLLIALHPRLIEYSCNGYAESFCFLAYTTGIAYLTFSLTSTKAIPLLVAGGAAFGVYFCTRNEALVALALALSGILLSRKNQTGQWTARPLKSLVWVLLGFLVVTSFYIALSEYTTSNVGIFQKATNFAKPTMEELDPHQAAKEIYGKTPHVTAWTQAVTLLLRIPSNLIYILERLPAILITPIWLFAFLLPCFAQNRTVARGQEWPLFSMLLFPLVFYVLIQVQPRYLFPILIPLNIFGAAGLVACSSFAATKLNMNKLLVSIATGCVAISLAALLTLGFYVERNYRYNREVARWIDSNIPQEDLLVGSGFGYISTGAFLAGHHSEPNIWTDDPEALVDSVEQKHAHWLIVYEAFLKTSNPELLSILDHGLPKMELRFETKDQNGNRIQIYQLVR